MTTQTAHKQPPFITAATSLERTQARRESNKRMTMVMCAVLLDAGDCSLELREIRPGGREFVEHRTALSLHGRLA